ncbi:nucleotidyltransferase family protein [Rothia sp. ZJ1223]|uniref:nucleotidyltransferase family protein n=1 Tax=Rothia sp. ZJ1223 TaxID=2811098 RepID=UPI001956984D|nr:nucleotidyltransferase family protein [Rothia sp. ZJ1223]MBM7051399.1 nucleotidyltransferase family protein [Rothia sp. ZJ1223]
MTSESAMDAKNAQNVPLKARITLSHAHLQHLANLKYVDVLHVKGYAFGTDTYPANRTSSDVDLLVRPDHVETFIEVLIDNNWSVMTSFETGSDYHHAMTVYHPTWGLADIHRYFPGLDESPAVSFEKLWSQRRIKPLSNFPCPTLSIVDARILVYVHSARSTSPLKTDVRYLEDRLLSSEKEEMQQRVKELNAELAFAAATGRLDEFVHHRDYLFWKTASEPSPETLRWYARVKTARGLGAKVQTIINIFRVNKDHLAMELGHTPSRAEVRARFFSRFAVFTRKKRH